MELNRFTSMTQLTLTPDELEAINAALNVAVEGAPLDYADRLYPILDVICERVNELYSK
jgi:hypothetical protein